MNIVTVGIDLAKNVFGLHGVDQSGKAVFIKPKVVRCCCSRRFDQFARPLVDTLHRLSY